MPTKPISARTRARRRTPVGHRGSVRLLSLWVLASFAGVLAAPVVVAQDVPFSVGEGEGGPSPATGLSGPLPVRGDGTRPQELGEYVTDVMSRVSLRDELEQGWQRATEREATIRDAIERLRAARPAADTDLAQFEEWRRREIGRLEREASRTDGARASYQRQLGTVYGWIQNDRDFLGRARHRELDQSLGPLIGVGGAAFVPVWQRPTPGKLTASWRHSANVRNLGRASTDISRLTGERTAITQRMVSRTAPGAGSWVTEVDAAGNMFLRNGEQRIDLKEKATARSGDGSRIPNEEGIRKADSMRELATARSRIDSAVGKLKLDRAQAKDAKTVANLDKKIGELEAKRSQLEGDIRKYAEEKPKGGQVQGLVKSAAKWAAFSAGITVASNVISQMARNGWDPKSIDWGAAIEPLKTPEFWGGTAGSFALSMVASMIPGGTFIKTLASIGGAAIGWQLGTGNIYNTDWMQLATDTIGATLGVLLGTAIAGPIGGFIGGIAGQFVSRWLLGKLRDHLEQGASSGGTLAGQTSYGPTVDPMENYPDRQAADAGTQGPPQETPEVTLGKRYGPENVAELKADLDAAREEFKIMAESPGVNRTKLEVKQKEIELLSAELRRLRAQAAGGSEGR